MLAVPSVVHSNAQQASLVDFDTYPNSNRAPSVGHNLTDLYDHVQQDGPGIDNSKIPEIDWSLPESNTFETFSSHTSLPSSQIVRPTIPEVFHFNERPPYLDNTQAIQLTPSIDGFELMRPLNGLANQNFSSQTSEGVSVCKVDFDWSTLLNLSSPRSPAFAILDPGIEESERTEVHHGTSHNQNDLTSPDVPQNSLGNSQADRGTPFSFRNCETTNHKKPISLSDNDAEDIIWPLQLMKSHLQMSSDHSRLQWHLSCGSTLRDLYSLISSRGMLLEVEDLLSWSYQTSHMTSLRRKALRRKDGLSYSSENSMEDNAERLEDTDTCEQIVRQDPGREKKRMKFTSYWLSLVPKGALSIRLKTAAVGSSAVRDSQSPWILSIQSMPKATGRTKGVSARFVSPTGNDDGPRISPHITTFNLVPEDSLIIHYISSNNTQGVKRLFESGEASPRDVDPWGFSLLSVSYFFCSLKIP